MKPLAELIASVPVTFSGEAFTAVELWRDVVDMGCLETLGIGRNSCHILQKHPKPETVSRGVQDAPLLALDLVLPSMSSGSILNLVLAMVPRT